MDRKLLSYRGCLLGFAVGDAMGNAVNDKTWPEIAETYGPNGLLGYDLCNGSAEVTSYTQVAAYVANALLVAMGRGKSEIYLRYGAMALKEWAKRQHFPRDPDPSALWISRMPQLRRRNCKDARMLDALRSQILGTTEKPINRAVSPGALSYALAVGLYFEPERMRPEYVGTLAAEMAAMTHGNEQAFLSAVVLAYSIAGILQAPEVPLEEQFLQALNVMQEQFGEAFCAQSVTEPVKKAIAMAKRPCEEPRLDMEKLECLDAAGCLAGAVYASLVYRYNFDEALICAINHSGASCAVGAVTGAILGARMGADALPEFYLESLDCVPILSELADDLARGSLTAGLFDTDWDHKYVQGLPLQEIPE